MRRRRISAAQLKNKRNKKIAGVLSVVFLVVLVIQVPKLMKEMSPPKATPPPASAAAAPATAGTPSVGASTPALASSASAASLPTAAPPELETFSSLPFKDPFHALIAVTTSGSSSTSTSTPSKTSTSTPKSTPTPKSKSKSKAAAKGQGTPVASGTVQFKATTPAPNAAIVNMNGKTQTVFVGDGFPAADPLFKLVALGEKTIRVGVFGGSFTNGVPTIRLAKGKKVTLANQADGSHYVIKLVRLTTATPPAPPASTPASTSGTSTTGTSTTPTTTTPASTTPTTTTP